MLYAIGEIILVVIGILIALQINNWKEQKKNDTEKRIVISNLNREFNQNKIGLKTNIKRLEECYKSTDFLVKLIGLKKDEIQKHNIDSIMYWSFEYERFSPSENAIIDLIQSGRLQLIKNESLKGLIYDWSGMNVLLLENYDDLDNNVDNIVSFLNTNYSLIDLDIYSSKKDKRRSRLKIDKLRIFQNIEFENLMNNHLYYINNYTDTLEKANVLMDDILKETEPTND